MPQIFQTQFHTGYSNVCVLHGIISILHFQKKQKISKNTRGAISDTLLLTSC